MAKEMSSKSAKKRQRQLAAAREMERRQNATASASPLTRDELDALWEAVAAHIANHGHDGSFSVTEEWLTTQDAPTSDCIAFLQSHRMNNDFDVLMHCDPRVMFGTDAGQRRRMPIRRQELDDLLDFLDREIPERGCNHTVSITEEWLTENGLPIVPTLMSCLALGGGCDCEILLNVEPDNVYTN